MREHEYHEALRAARARQLDGRATDDDRRHLKRAEREGLDVDNLGEGPCPGNSTQPQDGPGQQSAPPSAPPRRSTARTTGSRSKSARPASGTAPQATTSGPVTADSGDSG